MFQHEALGEKCHIYLHFRDNFKGLKTGQVAMPRTDYQVKETFRGSSPTFFHLIDGSRPGLTLQPRLAGIPYKTKQASGSSVSHLSLLSPGAVGLHHQAQLKWLLSALQFLLQNACTVFDKFTSRESVSR